jgi:hypothetical protein
VSHRLRKEAYRNRLIVAEATRKAGGWCWCYLIDGRVRGEDKAGLLPTSEAALLQAIAAARTRVDELALAGWQ